MKLPTRKCKNCGTTFQKLTPLHFVCSPKCAIAYAKELQVKRERQEAKQARAETRERLQAVKPLTKYAHEAQTIFNQFIRERDAHLPCISCGKHHTGQYHAGHYRTRGSAGHLRFSEDNTHKQCAPCNNHLSGNIVNYRPRLIQKIGLERVEALENDSRTHRWTKEELIEIKRIYKEKIKQLKQQKEGALHGN